MTFSPQIVKRICAKTNGTTPISPHERLERLRTRKIMEWIRQILEPFPDPEVASRTITALSQPETPVFRPFDDSESALCAVKQLKQLLPISVLPIGQSTEGLIGLDLCSAALERGVLPVLRLAPDGIFFESLASSLAVWLGDTPDFPDNLKRHPTSFAVYTDHALAEPTPSDGLAALWANVFLRPLYTARSHAQIQTAQSCLITQLETSGGDPLSLRLARCGLDAEQWRVVGAERAVANRMRDALRSFEGALFLGAPRPTIIKLAERMYRAARWTVGIRLLEWHRQVTDSTS